MAGHRANTDLFASAESLENHITDVPGGTVRVDRSGFILECTGSVAHTERNLPNPTTIPVGTWGVVYNPTSVAQNISDLVGADLDGSGNSYDYGQLGVKEGLMVMVLSTAAGGRYWRTISELGDVTEATAASS